MFIDIKVTFMSKKLPSVLYPNVSSGQIYIPKTVGFGYKFLLLFLHRNRKDAVIFSGHSNICNDVYRVV